jgi:AraC-like DNA-binding protein
MPIYMDIHDVPGAEALDLAEAHRKDMLIQGEYRCKCITYWLDETRGNAFCLIEAPDQSMVEEMHRNSHGFVPHKVIEVKNDVVESFLGRIRDPEDAPLSDNGLKVISDSAFRILLVTEQTDPVLLRNMLGLEKANDLMNRQTQAIRKALAAHGGREVEAAGTGFIASFTSAVKALSAAQDILQNLPKSDRGSTGLRIAINAGEPISRSDKLFGDVIQLARRLCSIANPDQIAVTAVVKDLLARDHFELHQKNILATSHQDETLVESMFDKLEKNWQNPDFAVTQFCKKMSMSKSQLYRKTTALWDLSPNQLLKEFRLDKARELLKGKSYNIAETTFDSGFTSPSYFTKCFKKKFGVLPANYLNALH